MHITGAYLPSQQKVAEQAHHTSFHATRKSGASVNCALRSHALARRGLCAPGVSPLRHRLGTLSRGGGKGTRTRIHGNLSLHARSTAVVLRHGMGTLPAHSMARPRERHHGQGAACLNITVVKRLARRKSRSPIRRDGRVAIGEQRNQFTAFPLKRCSPSRGLRNRDRAHSIACPTDRPATAPPDTQTRSR